ncbi:MAG: hypothetical protein RIS85_2266 [Pseudomonadota bacterium]|jgi:hypothetical protein
MRSDIKTLLDRLGRNDFQYREFADRFSDLETWPIFEAVLKDRRVLHHASLPVSAPQASVPDAGPSQAPLGAALSRKYGGGGSSSAAGQPQDVRSLLARISTAVDKGAF